MSRKNNKPGYNPSASLHGNTWCSKIGAFIITNNCKRGIDSVLKNITLKSNEGDLVCTGGRMARTGYRKEQNVRSVTER